MGWCIEFLLSGEIAVRCTTFEILNSHIYPNLKIFQYFVMYMIIVKKKYDPRSFTGNDYYEWLEEYCDNNSSTPNKELIDKYFEMEDDDFGIDYFELLRPNEQIFLQKEYNYFPDYKVKNDAST
jgi:hypothetical protein